MEGWKRRKQHSDARCDVSEAQVKCWTDMGIYGISITDVGDDAVALPTG